MVCLNWNVCRNRLVVLAALCCACSCLYSQIAVGQETAVDEAAAVTDENLPSGKDVYDRYIEATGGRERFSSLQTNVMTGNMEMSGMKAPISIHRQRPGKIAVFIEIEGFGNVSQGTNGEIAWDVSPMKGARLLEGKEKDEMIKRADFDEAINPEKYYKSMECTAKEEYEHGECYVVEFTSMDDNVEKRFFDTASYLMVMVETKKDTPLGKMKVVSKLTDYRDVDGIKTPFRNELSVMGQTQVIQFEDVQYDAELEATAFDPPEEIVKLMEKKDQSGEAAEEPAS